MPTSYHGRATVRGVRIEGLRWDDWNVEHIARHRVIPKEVEEVVLGAPRVFRARDGRYLAMGRTHAGRHLLITARDMTAAERRRWSKK